MVIKELVRAIFLRPDFRAPATRTGLVRSPVEWMAATMQALGLPAATPNPSGGSSGAASACTRRRTSAGGGATTGGSPPPPRGAEPRGPSYVRWQASETGIFAGFGSLAPDYAVTQALNRFGIEDPSPVTRAALEAYVAGEQRANRRWAVQPNLVALCMMTPDFQMA